MALTVTFQLSHCLEEAITAPPEGPPVRREWHIHQVEATADFAQQNALLGWYVGGLNHQIEHHLFPRVPHTLHPQLADIVRRTSIECGIAYNAHPTFRAALRSHTRWLREMGMAPAELARRWLIPNSRGDAATRRFAAAAPPQPAHPPQVDVQARVSWESTI